MGQFTFRYGIPAPKSRLPAAYRLRNADAGYINGWLVAVVKLPPFIVTLGMWQIILAANFLYSAQRDHPQRRTSPPRPPLLQFFGNKINIGGAIFTYRRRSSW